jgi:hypothetical protein
MDKTNNAYISIEIIIYKLFHCLWIIPMHRHTNVDEMGINPRTSLLQYRKLTHPKLPPNNILTGALIGVCLVSPVVPGTCSTLKATHRNHAWVHVAADGTQICVYDATVAMTIPVDVLSGLGTYRHDKWPLLQCPRRGDYERTLVPTKHELVTSYIN